MGYDQEQQRVAMGIRRDAEALGLVATKSRVRRPHAIGFGAWEVRDGRRVLFSGNLDETAEFVAGLIAERTG